VQTTLRSLTEELESSEQDQQIVDQIRAKNAGQPVITVVGVGGAGGNAINNMVASQLGGVEFVAANSDAQALASSLCSRRVQLGLEATNGLGAGANPETGRAAALEGLGTMREQLLGSDMVFITAGMGGGTGTGAAPVVARLAQEMGILTVGIVSTPFRFEGRHRARLAEAGLEQLSGAVDTMIVVPNQNLMSVAHEKTTMVEAFQMADDVLLNGIRGVTDVIVSPGLINVDFADVNAVMRGAGQAVMGFGEATGPNRATEAAKAALSNPILGNFDLGGAGAMLVTISGGTDVKLFEVDTVMQFIYGHVPKDTNLIFGSAHAHDCVGKMRVSVIVTGETLLEESQFDGSARPQAVTDTKAGASSPLQGLLDRFGFGA
jgi:cell division protein FtsZ